MRAPGRHWGGRRGSHPDRIDARARSLALIIDHRVTIMGSNNWSKGAASNSKDLNAVTSSEVAET
jgi:hypothetical protein